MPGRDYTRAFELLRDTLDDGYYGERHLNRYSFGASSSYGTLPGDLWMQSLMEKEKNTEHIWKHEDDQDLSSVTHPSSREHHKTSEPTGDLYTIPPTRSLYNKKSKTHPDFLRLPTSGSTPSSSTEHLRTKVQDGNLSSSYTSSFRTARETALTSTPGSLQQRMARFESADNTRNASVDTLQERHIRERTRPNDTPELPAGGLGASTPHQLETESEGRRTEYVKHYSLQDFSEQEDDMPLLGRWSSSKVAKDNSQNARQAESATSPDILGKQHHPENNLQSRRRAEPVRPSTPHTSRVIEALVVDTTPPHQKRNLRHAVKDLDLRDTASHSEHSNRTSYSDGSVLASKTANEERLSTLLRTVPSLESDRSGSTGSRTLRHTRKGRSPSASRLGRSEDKEEESSPADTPSTAQVSATHASSDTANLPKDSPKAHQLERQATDTPKGTTRTPVPSVLSPEFLRDVYSPKHIRQFSAASGMSYDGRKLSTASEMIGLGISDNRNLSPLGMSYSLRKASHQSSIFQSSMRRPSDNASIMSSVASPRSYHFRSRSSPISFNSEGNYTPNLVEATAINLYPHHNTSLLLVQQQGLSEMLNHEQLSSMPLAKRPTIIVDLPVNDFDYETGEYRASVHDSEHERKRETPPSFQLIPPTPGDDRASGVLVPLGPSDEYNASGTQATPHSPPTRQASLLQRARAYSNSTIQPFLSRTFSNSGSVRRTTSRRRRLFDSGARLSRPQVENEADMTEEARNLHPFWQPRDFWDGVKEEEEHNYQSEDAVRRLPEENPAQSEVKVQQQNPPMSWRRGGSLRFLVGNSLGIDRQPTNRRLPMVRWPSRKTTEKKPSRVFVHGHTLRTVRSVTVLGRMRQRMDCGGSGKASRKGSRSRRRRRWKKGLRCGLGK